MMKHAIHAKLNHSFNLEKGIFPDLIYLCDLKPVSCQRRDLVHEKRFFIFLKFLLIKLKQDM